MKEPLNHEPAIMSFGPVVALEDVVALKVGALHDRGVLRDVIDVHAASRLFSLPDLVAMARSVLDEEFRLESLRDQLDRVQDVPGRGVRRLRDRRGSERCHQVVGHRVVSPLEHGASRSRAVVG
jgi:hypothetical protein